MKKQFYLSVILVLFSLTYTRLASADPYLQITQPYENSSVSSVESSFVFGAVSPATCSLSINGVPVQPHTNGGFLVMIPFKPGKFRIDAVATDGISTTTVTRVVNVAEAAKSFSDDAKEIIPITPKTTLVLRPGDVITPSFQGAPGGSAFFRIGPQGEPIPMLEQNGGVKGIYKGIYRIQYGDAFDGTDFYFHLKTIHGVKISKKAGASLTVQRRKVPRVVELNEETIILTGPDSELGYQLFFQKGVHLEVTGEWGDFYHVAIGGTHDGWIKKATATELPAGIVLTKPTVFNLKITTSPVSTIIEIPLSSKVGHRIEQYTDPDKLNLTLFGAVADADRIRYKSENSIVKEITWRQEGTDVLVEVQTKQNYPWGYDVRYEGNTLILELRHRPVLSPTRNQPLKGLKIVLDAGHSKQNYGTIGPWGNTEASVVLSVAKIAKVEFEKLGAEVVLTQDGTREISLKERTDHAWKERAQIFISLHNDACPDGQNPREVQGYSVHYYSAQSRLLAEEIHSLYGQKTKIRDQGLWRSNLAVCRMTQMPSILVELAFLILPEYEEMLMNPKFQENVSNILTTGVISFLNKAQ